MGTNSGNMDMQGHSLELVLNCRQTAVIGCRIIIHDCNSMRAASCFRYVYGFSAAVGTVCKLRYHKVWLPHHECGCCLCTAESSAVSMVYTIVARH